MKRLSETQLTMLRHFEQDGYATDYADFHDRAGAALGWLNRERVIDALRRRGLLDDDGVTEAGRKALAEAGVR